MMTDLGYTPNGDTSVPEPGTFGLLGFGLLSAGLMSARAVPYFDRREYCHASFAPVSTGLRPDAHFLFDRDAGDGR